MLINQGKFRSTRKPVPEPRTDPTTPVGLLAADNTEPSDARSAPFGYEPGEATSLTLSSCQVKMFPPPETMALVLDDLRDITFWTGNRASRWLCCLALFEKITRKVSRGIIEFRELVILFCALLCDLEQVRLLYVVGGEVVVFPFFRK